ncbi:alpha/beta hydrolase [Dokdonella sp.]|uniref:alpha/beta fold hydrolase n=1 Tax=Dokdonella sp. TaxID=2291710 RepID=UPI001AFCFE71|nr:alpha/beta hydrolase [Dokdonella sp.]MBO9661509.1 alpha/beta hydrolase [Dokdonella sp.]
MRRAPLPVLRRLLGFALSVPAAAFGAGERNQQTIVDTAYAAPQRLVDVGGGRRLNLHCVGAGSPTVVFDAGLANWSQIWGLVQPVVAKTTRACAYDRAGLGFSDPAQRPGTSANIVDDLHRLLQAAAVEPPYVLVGHSYGGRNVRLYADIYRAEVAGLVLDDGSTEEYHWHEAFRARATPERIQARRARTLAEAEPCIEAARRGFVPGTLDHARCVTAALNGRYADAISRVYMRLEQTPSFLQARLWETLAYDEDSPYQLLLGWRPYGDLPMIVLTRALSETPSGLPDDEDGRRTLEQQRNVAGLSTRGVQRIVPNASHDIHFDQPQAVVAAIEEVVAAARESAGAARPKRP